MRKWGCNWDVFKSPCTFASAYHAPRKRIREGTTLHPMIRPARPGHDRAHVQLIEVRKQGHQVREGLEHARAVQHEDRV